MIKEYVQVNGYPPSRLEIANAVGLSSISTVNYQVNRLEERGYLDRGEAGPGLCTRSWTGTIPAYGSRSHCWRRGSWSAT
jgi:SOS-response transcriptional repressor LexA